jgi:hypothetical protein
MLQRRARSGSDHARSGSLNRAATAGARPAVGQARRVLAAQADTAKAPAPGGLNSSFPKSRSKARLQAARAAQLAEGTLGKIEDPAAPPQKRAQRKRKLTIGPHEFREYRIDQPEEYSSVRFASGDMTETPVPGACVAQADGAKLDE